MVVTNITNRLSLHAVYRGGVTCLLEVHCKKSKTIHAEGYVFCKNNRQCMLKVCGGFMYVYIYALLNFILMCLLLL